MLSKNSEDGNSCPKSHEAARFGWEELVSIETETINRNMDSITMKLTALQVKIDAFGDRKTDSPITCLIYLNCSVYP